MKHAIPKDVFKGATLLKLTPRGQRRLESSIDRFKARGDSEPMRLISGEIGTVDRVIIKIEKEKENNVR